MPPLQLDLLLNLKAASPYGQSVETLLTDMRALRHRDLDAPSLKVALRSLADLALISLVPSLVSPRWRLTGLGESTLREAGLSQ